MGAAWLQGEQALSVSITTVIDIQTRLPLCPPASSGCHIVSLVVTNVHVIKLTPVTMFSCVVSGAAALTVPCDKHPAVSSHGIESAALNHPHSPFPKSTLWVCLFYNVCVWDQIGLPFCDHLASLSIVSLKHIHVVECTRIYCLLKANILLYHPFIYWWTRVAFTS